MLVKVCSKLIHPREYYYASKSKPGSIYVVVSSTILNDEFCTCPGWQFRGTCSHIDHAKGKEFCDWYGGLSEDNPGVNTCPQCGGTTEDFETDAEFD